MDCYAGTGALGLEALSRGSSQAIFVESGKAALQVIDQNIATLGVGDRSLVLRCAVERASRALSEKDPIDLILADPPWPICHAAAIDTAALAKRVLKPDGVLVLGHPSADPVELAEESGFELTDRRRWGGSGMSWYAFR
jgi:16S rRNA (guanine966-N2)-methyltransferase